MVTEELIDFIQKSRLFGRSDDEIRKMLADNGWVLEDIEAGLKSAEFNPTFSEKVVKLKSSKPPKALVITFLILFLLTGLGLGGYFAYKNYLRPLIDSYISGEAFEEDYLSEDNSSDPEKSFAEKLKSCTAYKITFKHPITGEDLEKEIRGIVEGKCLYVEQMPNNGRMECRYTVEERLVAARYYIDMANAETAKTDVEFDLETGKQRSTYKIDGNNVDNPLESFMNSGVCKVLGY